MSRMERRRLEEQQRVLAKKGGKKSIINIILIVLIVLAILVATVTIASYWYVNSKLNQLTELPVNADVENYSEYDLSCVNVDGYINVLVLGIDARDINDPNEEWRTDAIMIASIKEDTGDVYLTSLYRDTLFYLPGQGFYDKINHAFTYGGVQETMKAINQAMDLDIKNYVVFNIGACVDIIDAMGGLELDIEEYEISELNKYNKETWRISGQSGSAPQVVQAGTQHVDGSLAVTYGRIRKGVGDDYKRTERMRIVVGKMLDKVKTLSFKEIDNLLDIGLPQVKTNLSNSDIMGLGFKVFNFKISGSTSFPYTISDGYMGAVSYVFPTDLYNDVARLHREFFNQPNYIPSETAFNISSVIYQYAMGSGDAPEGEYYEGGDGWDIGGSSMWVDVPEPEPEPWVEPDAGEYVEPEPIVDPGTTEEPVTPGDPGTTEEPVTPVDPGTTEEPVTPVDPGTTESPEETPVETPPEVVEPPQESTDPSSSTTTTTEEAPAG